MPRPPFVILSAAKDPRLRPLVLACLLVLTLARADANDVSFKITDAKNTPVADAVVSLVPLDANPKPSPPAKPALSSSNGPLEIAQQGQEFLTFVTPVVIGTTVNFPNEDEVSHQVYSQSSAKKFALPLYKPGNSGQIVFDRPGVAVLGCNIHDWMLAYVVVLETPWFAKTGGDGTATVAGPPPGRYRAEVWHPRLAQIETRELTLGDGAAPTQTFTLALKPDRRIRRTPASAGGGYK